MIKKRLVSSIIYKDDSVVQSFNYKTFLPIGSIESSVKNLNRWNADEILILSIERSKKKIGPDFDLLNKIKNLKIETPIIYGGGISNLDDAKKVIALGADRIVVESIIDKNYSQFEEISKNIGKQSIILSMPLSINQDNEIRFFDHKTQKEYEISDNFIKAIKDDLISEILISDYKNQGTMNGFDLRIIKKLNYTNDLILSGGIYKKNDFKKIFRDKRVVASAVGNNLNYGEHRIQKFKSNLKSSYLRKPFYSIHS